MVFFGTGNGLKLQEMKESILLAIQICLWMMKAKLIESMKCFMECSARPS
jgi:hypothetical protein